MNTTLVAFRRVCVCVWIRPLLLALQVAVVLKAADIPRSISVQPQSSQVALASSDPVFTSVQSDPVVVFASSTGCAWGDYNNDGWIDLAVSSFTGNYLLYTNNGNGTFTQVLTGDVAATSGASFGACWSDYDNDGNLDLFVGRNSNLTDALFHNDGNGVLRRITAGDIVSGNGNANNCVWGDYDNDGFVDLFVANSDQNDYLLHNNGNGTFTRMTNGVIALKPGNSQGGSWCDYDNDGLIDLFVSRVNEPNLLYHNEGGGNFRAVTNGAIVNEAAVGQGTSWGDYDNDGYPDLFVANPAAKNFLYHNNGDGTFAKITNNIVADDSGGTGCGWADFDNDGYLDLFVSNRLGPNNLYHNNGDGTFTRLTNSITASEAGVFAVAWGDCNNDGFPDLFMTKGRNGINALFLNNGNSNRWIVIQAEGRKSNRAAIGAKVRVKAIIGGKLMWQLREISGGGGLGSQNDLRAAFGLGDATNVDCLRIEWPSGMVQELSNLAPKQFLKVVEPTASISPPTQQVAAGETATFTVATTLPPPLTYQWRLNGAPLPGETNLSLIIPHAELPNAGNYSVRITNPQTGFSFSTPSASLTGPVVITLQPESQTLRAGSNVTFRVVATGSGPLTYQWRFNSAALPGATSDTLTVTNLHLFDDGAYTVAVSNSYGQLVSSETRLVVWIRPVITVQPVSQKAVIGGSVTFSVVVDGNPPPFGFRWRKNGLTQTNIVLNDKISFFTVTNIQPTETTNVFSYSVGVTNAAGSILTSNAVLTVLADTDGDGLPDEWELANSLNPTNAADAALDSDGDGLSNLQEYLSGTNPNDAASRLRIEAIDCGPGHPFCLRFTALSNKTYTVQSCPFLQGTSWNSVADVPAASSNHTVVIIDPTNPPTGTLRLYRLVTPRAATP